MGLWTSISGRVTARITSANVENDLYCLIQNNIVLDNVIKHNELTADITIRRADFNRLNNYLSSGADVELIGREGIYWSIHRLIKRPVLIAGLFLYLLLLFVIPNHILFYKVVGNSNITTEEIIFHAQQVGLPFGASRQQVRSETIKNDLLLRIPKLRWVGVNTYGCVAVITVKEDVSQEQGHTGVINSIVAKSDAVVEKIVVNRGDVKCKVGQVVMKGDLLVSGYADCGHSVKFTGADAEIYGRTNRLLYAYTPLLRRYREEETGRNEKYSIYFGKKLINLWNDSGIPGVECAKIYSEYCVRLPGGFVLPLGLVKQTEIHYKLQQRQQEPTDLLDETKVLADHYIENIMNAGQILNANFRSISSDERLELIGSYTCRELIGKYNFEEIIAEHD